MELSEISVRANPPFSPQDYQDHMGIYNFGKNDARFSNFDFSSLEKE